METIDGLLLGFQTILNPTALMFCFIGVFLGTFVGVLPGIGALAAISLLLPVTFHLPTVPALMMLAGVYNGSQYGGSIAAILLNIPGTPQSVVTSLDGNPLAKQGRPGVALFVSMFASFWGALLGILLLVLAAPTIAEWGVKLGPPEYFSIMLLGLVAACSMAGADIIKGLAMVVLGLLLGTVGADLVTGVTRFDFGVSELYDGINLIPLALGIFGLTEVMKTINIDLKGNTAPRLTLKTMLPTRGEIKRCVMPIFRGSSFGGIFGALPGAGGSLSTFISYAVERKVSKHPERFGQGAVEGIAAPESSNNAAAVTSFIPTLTMGIPGDVVMALMLGAMIIHGIQPGPLLITQQPALFWGLIVSFIIGNFMLLVLNGPLVGMWVKLLRIPFSILYPAILIFISLGAYSVNGNVFDIYATAMIGVLGYALSLTRFSPAPLLLGFVLGPMLEENFRTAMLYSRGDLAIFTDSWVSLIILTCTALFLLKAVFSGLRKSATKAVNA